MTALSEPLFAVGAFILLNRFFMNSLDMLFKRIRLNITKGIGPCRCVVEKGTFLVKCSVPKVIWTIRWSDVPDPYNEDVSTMFWL